VLQYGAATYQTIWLPLAPITYESANSLTTWLVNGFQISSLLL
jgi:hypothetical protein